MQQATFDPDATVEMDTLDADAVRDELSQLYNRIFHHSVINSYCLLYLIVGRPVGFQI